VKSLVEAVADNAPGAFIHFNPSQLYCTPYSAEVLKQKAVYDPKKLYGVMTLDAVRADTFVASEEEPQARKCGYSGHRKEVMLGLPSCHCSQRQGHL